MGPVRYAINGDVHLAFTSVGDGALDVVWVPGWFSDFERAWQLPGFGGFLDELSDLGRLITFDKRGTGQSDRIVDGRYPTLEERVEDVITVMDAAGSDRAALVGASEGGTQALLAAARHPERVSAVVTIDAWARLLATDDKPDLGILQEEVAGFIERSVELWGTGAAAALMAPSQADDPAFVEQWAALERRAASPAAIAQYGLMIADLDIGEVLPEVRVPTLVIHATGDRMVPVEQGRFLARELPDARLVEVPSRDHLPYHSHPEVLIAEIQRHLLGRVGSPAPPRREFAAILFSDIVDSTDRAAAIGDRAWRSRLDGYEQAAARVVEEHGGRVVKSTGDGTLATFPDPQASVLAARQLHEAVAVLGMDLRAGLHCGQVELRGEDVGGLGVHIAARVAGVAPPRATLVSSTMRDVLLGSGFEFVPAGTRALKGVPGEWALFELRAD